ncbi:MAG: hypothetical protein PHH70_00280 [Candidatus Gracilibacteria bacterium]|nr:hypothetical protein [Candidatus Gracilibacteria bacterium]
MAAIDTLNAFETQTLPAIDRVFEKLSPEKLSLEAYKDTYEALRKSINDVTKSFNEFYTQNPTIPDSLAVKWNDLLARKEILKAQFKNLPKPDTLTTLKGVNIGSISPHSGSRDITLSSQEILSMRVGKYIANSDECEYYIIDINRSYKTGDKIEKKVLRIHTNNDSFELALVDITSDLNDAESIQRFIFMNEEARNFQDIEIDGSAMIDRDYTSADAKKDGLYAKMQQVKTYAVK